MGVFITLNLNAHFMNAAFKIISTDELRFNPFTRLSRDWILITAEVDKNINCMTASWGGAGVMWNRPVAIIFLRHSRYTKELVDKTDSFSITTFDVSKYKEMLSYMGSVSGRQEDKISKMGLTVDHCDGVPFFDEASYAVICKKLCCQEIQKENIPEDILKTMYPKGDQHCMYIGEICKVLKK
jgi:flavin reductase (DIM6/NTAB) family NADH-FMN oxidoreductase RutF